MAAGRDDFERDQTARASAAGAARSLGRRIERVRRERGWTRDQLARRAGVSRTTLHHIENGQTARPRADTLARLATALGLAPAELHVLLEDAGPEAPRARFDRVSNGEIDALFDTSPELFQHWTAEDWDELYSTFGTGGRLTEEGVRREVDRRNRQRETLDKLRIVLDTHLADVAERMVATLFEMIALDDDTAGLEALPLPASLPDSVPDMPDAPPATDHP